MLIVSIESKIHHSTWRRRISRFVEGVLANTKSGVIFPSAPNHTEQTNILDLWQISVCGAAVEDKPHNVIGEVVIQATHITREQYRQRAHYLHNCGGVLNHE